MEELSLLPSIISEVNTGIYSLFLRLSIFDNKILENLK